MKKAELGSCVGDLKKEIGGELSLNVATSSGLSQREFFRYKKKNKKERGRGTEYETEKTIEEDSRDHVILVLVFSFSNSY